jgi:hypothetical protein
MTYAAHARDSVACAGHALPRRDAASAKPGILRRIFDAIGESRQRQTEREVARFIARRGGRITDEVEREIGRRLLTSNWSARG